MSKFKKILLIIASIFAFLSLLALFIPYFIDLNRYKPKIQEYVSEQVNAKVDYSSARLNFFGGIGIKIKDVELVNTKDPFTGTKLFVANDADVRFEFWPLFSKKLIGTIYIDKPTINIINIGSKNNIDSLKKGKASADPDNQTEEENVTESGFEVIINELSVNDANLIYKDITDSSAPTVINVQHINMSMVRDGDIIDIETLNMTLFSGKLAGSMKIDTAHPDTAYNGKFKIDNFLLEDIYKSFGGQNKKSPLIGKGNLDFTFNGRGTTKALYSKTLNADGNFNIESGQFKVDTAMPIVLDQLGQFLAGITLPSFKLGITPDDVQKAAGADTQTISLKGVKGKFKIRNGNLLVKNKIPMEQGALDLDLSIGIFTSKLSGIADFKATEAFTKSLLASNKNFAYLLDKDNKFALRIYLSGTVENPVISVDTKDIMKNILLHVTQSILNPLDTIDGVQETIKDTIKKILPF